jgi:GntR family transcriptional regulator, transcriptional repressor for pyruvate dehydrogenase complex
VKECPLLEKQPPRTSAVQRTAAALRALALEMSEGEFMGSEESLMVKLGVSRPTLRQATTLVAQEQLISTRRGVNGGYFAAVPSSVSVARMAAIFLRSRNTKLTDMVRAVEPIRAELARLASRQPDKVLRQRLEQFLKHERDQEPRNYRAFLRAERELGRVLGEAADNVLLSLFLTIVYDLVALVQHDEDVYVNRPERVERYRELRNRMVEAIIDGDEELAILSTRRCTAVVTDWIHEDLHAREAGQQRPARKNKRLAGAG